MCDKNDIFLLFRQHRKNCVCSIIDTSWPLVLLLVNLAETAEYSVVHGEVQPSLDNPIIRAVEIPAATLGNSTGEICFVTTLCFF